MLVEKPKLLLLSSATAPDFRTVLQLRLEAAAVRHSGLTSVTISVTWACTINYNWQDEPSVSHSHTKKTPPCSMSEKIADVRKTNRFFDEKSACYVYPATESGLCDAQSLQGV